MTQQAFNQQFWNESARCLYDVIDGDRRDSSVRPNQIFAISLGHGLLDHDRAKNVMSIVQKELLTPFGLRTLSPQDPAYRGRYEGDISRRDAAYHQGTVWPWLLGPFVRAYFHTYGFTPETTDRAGEWLSPLLDFLKGNGAGQIPEIFDGDAPHRPNGCIAQAWSVAEALRIFLDLRLKTRDYRLKTPDREMNLI